MTKNNLFIKFAWPVCFTFLAVLLCFAAPACSAYPQPTSGKRVYDFASLLSAEQETQLEQLTAGIAEATTAELDIVTVSSLHGETVEEYANNLFNEWGIGRADTNNGVLFLIAPNERRVRIEVGYGLEPLLTDGLCGNIIAKNIIPAFKAGRFDEGIISGAERIAGILRQHPEQAQGVKDSVPKFLRTLKRKIRISKFVHLIPVYLGAFLLIALLLVGFTKKYPFFLAIVTGIATLFLVFLWYINLKAQFPTGVSRDFIPFVVRDGKGIWFFFGSLFVLFPAIINIAKYIRFRPRRCKQCRNRMILLNKEEKSSFLDGGEQREEELGSVEYDIWHCRSCDYHKKRKGKTTGRYEKCPKCGSLTVKEKVVRSATTSQTGLTRMRCAYAACRHEYTEVIPRVTTSSSSSSGSSGSGYSGGGYSGGGYSGGSSGGSSGGGGASGGW